MLEEPYDASNPAHVKRARTETARLAASRDTLIRAMLGSPQARAFWWDIISSCGVFRAECLPSNEMYFQSGQRNVGLKLLAALPNDLRKLMEEEAAQPKEQLDV